MDEQLIGLKLTLDALGLDLDLSGFNRDMVLQRTIYLVQAANVDLGYTFGWYHRGPYAPGLTCHAVALKMLLTQNAVEPKDWRLDNGSQERLARVRSVFQTLPAETRARRLDLLASVHFLLQTGEAKTSDLAGLRAILLRNEKDFSESEIREAIERLKQHDLSPATESR